MRTSDEKSRLKEEVPCVTGSAANINSEAVAFCRGLTNKGGQENCMQG